MGQPPRWDVTDPGFLVTVLRVMALLGAGTLIAGVFFGRGLFIGLLSGVLLAILFYAATLQAGRIFLRSRRYGLVMAWLLGSQLLLWAGMAILIAVVKVNAVGFVFGISVLPGAIVLTTLYWWLVKSKGVML
ncbi:MAG: hypothetical protein ACYDCO_16825 [Armatimonadota bacterium]